MELHVIMKILTWIGLSEKQNPITINADHPMFRWLYYSIYYEYAAWKHRLPRVRICDDDGAFTIYFYLNRDGRFMNQVGFLMVTWMKFIQIYQKIRILIYTDEGVSEGVLQTMHSILRDISSDMERVNHVPTLLIIRVEGPVGRTLQYIPTFHAERIKISLDDTNASPSCLQETEIFRSSHLQTVIYGVELDQLQAFLEAAPQVCHGLGLEFNLLVCEWNIALHKVYKFICWLFEFIARKNQYFSTLLLELDSEVIRYIQYMRDYEIFELIKEALDLHNTLQQQPSLMPTTPHFRPLQRMIIVGPVFTPPDYNQIQFSVSTAFIAQRLGCVAERVRFEKFYIQDVKFSMLFVSNLEPVMKSHHEHPIFYDLNTFSISKDSQQMVHWIQFMRDAKVQPPNKISLEWLFHPSATHTEPIIHMLSATLIRAFTTSLIEFVSQKLDFSECIQRDFTSYLHEPTEIQFDQRPFLSKEDQIFVYDVQKLINFWINSNLNKYILQ